MVPDISLSILPSLLVRSFPLPTLYANAGSFCERTSKDTAAICSLEPCVLRFILVLRKKFEGHSRHLFTGAVCAQI
ncbi:hypothetical protein F5879DRAFT_267751 [Lentinula edodes]|nr:hypothetical protein F5879DRAFT_267751 [Lentinula edodes]